MPPKQSTELIYFFKHAELFGSRRWQENPRQDADWDWIVFTDDAGLRDRLRRLFDTLGTVQEAGAEVWVRCEEDVDLHVHPVSKREPTLHIDAEASEE